MNNCPFCHGALARSTTIIRDAITLRCVKCNLFTIEGADKWLPGGPGMRSGLEALHALQTQARHVIEEKGRDHDALTSDITDPRWTQIS